MFEFMTNAFYVLVGILCIGVSVTVLMFTLSVVVNTVRRTRKGGKEDAA